MLCLSRQVGEVICIGRDIKVMVTGIRGNKVRLGISAPPEVTVHRQEVHEAIERERARGDEPPHSPGETT